MSSYTESEEYKKRLLEKQNAFLERVAKANGQTVEQLTNYGNNAELLDKAANGEAVTISTPNTDAKKAAYYSQQAATPVSSYYDFLAKNALDTKGVTYAMAEKMRQESEALAEIQRKRSIVDASTMAEQQKATYGANAEQMGRMGLSGSGYSDYLNSQAYAAGMAGRQAANAQATDANRKAMYTEMMAKLEADKEYNNALAQIETAKYNEQREDKAQQQTNYMALLEAISNGSISKDSIGTYASALGITDTTMIDNATKYAGNINNTSGLETSLAAYEASKDFVNAAISYVDLNYPDATDEQKKTFQADYIVNHISEIDDSQLAEYAKKISNGDYGTAGGEAIKKAVSQTYIDSADTLSKEELETVLNSGILTTEAQTTLQADFDKRFTEKSEKKGVVDVNVSGFSMTDFGKETGSKAEDSKQSVYSSDLEKMIRRKIADKTLNEGDVICTDSSTTGAATFYKYIGDGKFKQITATSAMWSALVLPEGYEVKTKTVIRGKKAVTHRYIEKS